MRYAVVSDIHANLPAWNVVYTDVQSSGADEIICLGDVVGYGPTPADVLEKVYAQVHHFVLGNHDAVVGGKLNTDHFNAKARSAIEWTRQHLDDQAVTFFRECPYVLAGPNFRCSHGDPSSPSQFRYVLEPDDALRVWGDCEEQVVFIGHSHVPGIFVLGDSGVPHWLDPQDFALEAGKRYIVNVGSVGQPRDGDVRACYVVYDVESESVNFHRVAFDLEAYRQELEGSSIPVQTAHFLQVAESAAPPPLRDMLDFHPLDKPDPAAGDVTVRTLEVAVRAARRWRLGALILALLSVVALTVGAYLWLTRPPKLTVYPAAGSAQAALTPPDVEADCFGTPEIIGTVSRENCLAQWTVKVTDPDSQAVATELVKPRKTSAEKVVAFRLTSRQPTLVSVQSEPVVAEAGMRFRVHGTFKALQPVVGHLKLCLEQELPNGLIKPLVEHPIEECDPDRFRERGATSKELREAGVLRWVLQGEFTGDVLVHSCQMTRKP